MADFYGDGDENIDYSKRMDDFYGGVDDVSGDLEFQSFDHQISQGPGSAAGAQPHFEGLGSGFGSYGGFGSAAPAASSVEGGPTKMDGEYSFVDFAQPPGDDVPVEAPPPPELGDGEEVEEKPAHFWNVAYYGFLFDVDTKDVVKRLLYTCFMYPSFLDEVGDKPDLYGTFWISTTLIFLLGATGNFATYVSYLMEDREDEWEYDFTKVTFGAVLIYCYISIIPILFWSAFKYLESPVGMLDTYCLFGYSLFPYVPASLAMIVPGEWIRWGMVGLACLVITAFYARNIFPKTRSTPLPSAGIIGAAILCNVLFALALRLYFFEYVGPGAASGDEPPAPPPPAPAPDAPAM